MESTAKWTREVLIELGLEILARKGRALTIAEWNAEAGAKPSGNHVSERFGGWDAFWVACGAPPPPRKVRLYRGQPLITRKDVLEAARAALREHGRPLTETE